MYLTTNDICRELQLTRALIYRLIKEGMPALHIGNRYRYVLSDVSDWLNENYSGRAIAKRVRHQKMKDHGQGFIK